MEPENPLLDEFVRAQVQAQSGKQNPLMCFIPTASHDAQGYADRFHAAFQALGCRTSVLTLWDGHEHAAATIAAADGFFVGGGNTNDLLGKWRDSGVDRMLRAAYDAGKVMAGISAGSLCWFAYGVTDSFGPLAPLRCLGWIDCSNCVHYDGEKDRQPAYEKLVATGQLPAGYACDDGAAAVFADERFVEAVVSRPDARVVHVRAEGGRAVETPIVTRYLGTGATLVVRRAGVADADAMNVARQRSIATFCSKHYTPEQLAVWNQPIDRDRLVELIRTQAYWSIVIDGVVEGFAGMLPDGHMKALYLSPRAAGQGLGRRVMAGVERHARETGLNRLTTKATLNAVGFYTKLGFTATGPELAPPRHGVPLPHLPMEKRLV
jgi:peptidase E/GNAT superfamily N-acetyltransferase